MYDYLQKVQIHIFIQISGTRYMDAINLMIDKFNITQNWTYLDSQYKDMKEIPKTKMVPEYNIMVAEICII